MSFRPDTPKPENGFTKFLRFFTLLMSLIYPALGIYLLLSTQEQINLNKTTKVALGIILIIYGIYRFMRSYNQYFKKPRRPGQYD